MLWLQYLVLISFTFHGHDLNCKRCIGYELKNLWFCQNLSIELLIVLQQV